MSAIAAEEAGEDGAAVLQLEGISKDFGAIRALSEVDLTINAGDVVGLMGDNGAGKSTLVKIIAGNFHPTHGIDPLRRAEHRFDRPLDARPPESRSSTRISRSPTTSAPRPMSSSAES